MIVVYFAFTLALLVLRALIRRRAAAWDSHYHDKSACLERAEDLPEVDNPNDRAFFERFWAVEKATKDRDRAYRGLTRWQALSATLHSWVGAVRAWRGRKLPYATGVLDVLALKGTLDATGLGDYATVQGVIDLVRGVTLHG